MDKFVLSSDSSCDEFKSSLKERRIRYVPLTYTVDGVTNEDHFDTDESYEGFYEMLKQKKMPTTSQITAFTHEEYFDSVLDGGAEEIVHLTLSSGLSNTYNSAVMGAENSMEKHPGSKIYIVDSLSATQGQRMLLCDGEQMRDAGLSGKEAAKALCNEAAKIHHWILVDDLLHLKRGGRVSAASAYLGTMLKIKPVLIINDEGKLAVVHKAKGIKSGLKYFLDMYERYADLSYSAVYLASADAWNIAGEFEQTLLSETSCEVRKGWIGPIIGAHTGGGTLGFVFKASERLKNK